MEHVKFEVEQDVYDVNYDEMKLKKAGYSLAHIWLMYINPRIKSCMTRADRFQKCVDECDINITVDEIARIAKNFNRVPPRRSRFWDDIVDVYVNTYIACLLK